MKINRTIIGLMTGCIILFSFKEKNTPDKFKNDLKEMNLIGKVQSLKETIYYPVVRPEDPRSKGVRIQTTTIFNGSGNKTEESGYDLMFGNKFYKNTFEYDEAGNRSLQLSYVADGSLRRKVFFKHDDNGYVTEKITYSSNDSLQDKLTFKLDEWGNKTEQVYLTGSKTTYKYSYDKAGNIIELIQYSSDGKTDLRVTYKLDKKGNIIQQNNYHAGIKLVSSLSMKYTFDAVGNWIVKTIIFYDGKSAENGYAINERQIKYY